MSTKILHTDSSLISGQDHATVWKKSPDRAFYESDSSFVQSSGNFQNGGITRCDWYNSIPNSLLVDTHMHITIKNNDAVTEDAVLAHCRDGLTNYKVPKRIKFVDDIPKSPVGKVLRRELREKVVS